MPGGCIALVGDFTSERVNLRDIGAEFGWLVRQVGGLAELAAAPWKKDVRVVLLHTKVAGFPPHQALLDLRLALPDAKPIFCTGRDGESFPGEIAPPDAFTELRLPLNHTEVRHAIGFAWAAARVRQRRKIRENRRLHLVLAKTGAA